MTTSRICYLTLYRIYATSRISLAHRGASPETVPLAERGVASRGYGSYPQPREVRDPVRQALRPGREELAARIRRKCRRWKHGTPAENRHGGAPRGARPPLGTRGASQAPGVPRKSAFTRVSDALRHVAGAAAPERRLGAPPPLVGVDEGKVQTPDAMRRGNEKARVGNGEQRIGGNR